MNVDGTFINDRGVVPPSAREAVVAGSLQDIFDHAPGVVARCPICDQVLLRPVRGPAYLQFPVSDEI